MTEHRVSGTTDLVAAFERERSYLRTVALRMVGSDDDADDAVQEAWLRLNRTGGEGIEDLRAWLTTVTSRVCLDMLRTRRTRREMEVEIDLDDLLLSASWTGAKHRGPTPEDEVLLAESVGVALHIVMERLTPAERVAFVLHDIFDLPFGQIADVLGRSTGAVKMLASRARRRVRVVPRAPDAGGADDAFFAAPDPVICRSHPVAPDVSCASTMRESRLFTEPPRSPPKPERPELEPRRAASCGRSPSVEPPGS